MRHVVVGAREARAMGLVFLFGAATGCLGDEEIIGSGHGAQQAGDSGGGPCPAFEPGTNMLGEPWTLDPRENPRAAGFAQGAGDLAMASDAVLASLTQACRDIVIAAGGELEGPMPGGVPSTDDVQRACASALEAFQAFRAELGSTLAAEVVQHAACDLATGMDSCLDDCGAGNTCEPFCSTATLWYAPCSPAVYAMDASSSPRPDLVDDLPALGAGFGAVAAANERLARLMIGSASAPDDAWTMTPACVDVVVDSLEETVVEVEVSTVAADALLRALLR